MTAGRMIRGATAAAVLVVAAIGAVVSFVHIEHLAVTHGQAPLAAYLLPLSVAVPENPVGHGRQAVQVIGYRPRRGAGQQPAPDVDRHLHAREFSRAERLAATLNAGGGGRSATPCVAPQPST